MSKDVIERSLECVAEKIGDPTNLVYQRLFMLAPELESLFAHNDRGSIRVEMLHQVFDAALDLGSNSLYAEGMIAAESINHRALGVEPTHFVLIFEAIIACFRDTLGQS